MDREKFFLSVILSIETITYVLDNYRSIKQYDSDGNYIAEKYKLDSPYFSFTQADDDCLWLFDSNINGKSSHFLYYQSETDSAYGISKPNSIKGKMNVRKLPINKFDV